MAICCSAVHHRVIPSIACLYVALPTIAPHASSTRNQHSFPHVFDSVSFLVFAILLWFRQRFRVDLGWSTMTLSAACIYRSYRGRKQKTIRTPNALCLNNESENDWLMGHLFENDRVNFQMPQDIFASFEKIKTDFYCDFRSQFRAMQNVCNITSVWHTHTKRFTNEFNVFTNANKSFEPHGGFCGVRNCRRRMHIREATSGHRRHLNSIIHLRYSPYHQVENVYEHNYSSIYSIYILCIVVVVVLYCSRRSVFIGQQ